MDFQKTILVIGILASSFLLAGCDSSANEGGTSAGPVRTQQGQAHRDASPDGQFDYELRTEQRSVQDDRFPFGFWEVIRVYPELVSKNRPAVADSVNERISALAHEYGCEEMGDEGFHTREIYLGSDILSMAYEATWLCATMQSPEIVSGFLNLDLADGSELDLEAQFRDRYTYEQFQKSALEALNDEVEVVSDKAEVPCPVIRSISGFHTDGKELWVASVSRDRGSVACNVKVGFPLASLRKQLKPDSPLRVAGAN